MRNSFENPQGEEVVNNFEDDVVGTDQEGKEFSEEKRPNLEALKAQRDKYILEAIEKVRKDWLGRIGTRFVKDNLSSLSVLVRAQIFKDHGIDEETLESRTKSLETDPRDKSHLLSDEKEPIEDSRDLDLRSEMNDAYSLGVIDKALEKYIDDMEKKS